MKCTCAVLGYPPDSRGPRGLHYLLQQDPMCRCRERGRADPKVKLSEWWVDILTFRQECDTSVLNVSSNSWLPGRLEAWPGRLEAARYPDKFFSSIIKAIVYIKSVNKDTSEILCYVALNIWLAKSSFVYIVRVLLCNKTPVVIYPAVRIIQLPRTMFGQTV